jgi:hypothetical protein
MVASTNACLFNLIASRASRLANFTSSLILANLLNNASDFCEAAFQLPSTVRVDRQRRARPETIRNAFTAPHKSNPDLSPDRNLRAVHLLLGHTKIESTVRYLGVEVHDALAIVEQVDV